ncbi:hypothetical protein PybrP1_006694 [[Pythium] brassicae (nom. inval.)]|nr:hypothetical protein PybrP1_006694 [[Pythium] brassicae (nom. inval.)]
MGTNLPLPDVLAELFTDGPDRYAAAQLWVSTIHAAFYAPTTRTGSSSNKFLELEAALVDAVTRVLQLREPKASLKEEASGGRPSGSLEHSAAAGGAARPSDSETRGANAAKPKPKKKSAQPYAPLAFVVVNALRKLSRPVAAEDGAEAETNASPGFAAHISRLGRTSAELRDFCQRGLEQPQQVDQKLLVELLDLFQLVHFDAPLLLAAGAHLVASKSYSAVIKLCSLFRDLPWPFERMVRAIAQGKDWVSAELLTRSAGAHGGGETVLAKALVEEAIALREFKRAHRLVHAFALQREFPDIGHRDGLLKIIEKRKWQLALTFVGNDATLRRILFDHVAAAGEVALATQLAESLGIADYEPDPSQLAAQRSGGDMETSARNGSAKHLPLPLPSDSVVFCSDEQQIREAYAHFFDATGVAGGEAADLLADHSEGYSPARLVGLDVEWKPTTSRISNQTVASILQIATTTRVFVIDLLMLHENEFLFEHFLPRLLSSPQLLKVGFGFDSDMKVLHQSFPERSAFLHVAPFLELSSLVLKAFGASAGKSLSTAATRVLGKPLDKSMQLSDWDARPLSAAQMHYAALDAFCLVQILQAIASVVEHIAQLDNTSTVSADVAAELTRLRGEYVERWRSELPQGLLTPEDIIRFWELRRAEYEESLSESQTSDRSALELGIKFLSAAAVSELLAQDAENQHDSVQSRHFTHINSICFFADGVPFVACIDATLRLDTTELARVCGVGRRKLKLATPAECRRVFGFLPGTVPPFGHRAGACHPPSSSSSSSPSRIQVFVDASLQAAKHFISGGGSPDAFLWLSTDAFFRVLDVTVAANIATSSSSSAAASSSMAAVGASVAVAESDTVNGSNAEAPALKFVADSMATQVARWLRTIGVDVVTWDADRHVESSPSVVGSQSHRAQLLAFAAREHRIILTRDTQLASRRDAGACLVLSSDVCYKQFREVKAQFGLSARMDGSVSRCARCNATEFVAVDEAVARARLRPSARMTAVLATVSNYWMCSECKRIYWEGPKYTTTTTTGSVADGEVAYRPQERQRRTRQPGYP